MSNQEQIEYAAQREIDALHGKIDALQAENERLRAESQRFLSGWERLQSIIAAALAIDVTEDWDALERVREILEKA